jgi:hypothetical protein
MARPGEYCFGGTVAGSRVAAVTLVRCRAVQARSETSERSDAPRTGRVRSAAAVSCTVGRPVDFLF